jgi:putative PIN family toxin of toxin-antitoxin system
MRIVADTNTLVSGFGWGGPPGQVVDTVLSGQVILVTSPALLGELARVLAYPKLAAIFDDPALVAAVAEAADTVDPAEHVTVLADEPGNRVLEAAAAGRADLIVTGDKAMQELGSFQGIPIVSAAQFVARLQQQGHSGPAGPGGQTS